MLNLELEQIQREIDNTDFGNRRSIVSRYAERAGVSEATVYRALRKRFGKQRTFKKGQDVDQRLIDMVAQLKIKGMKMGLGERELSTDICIKMLRDQGVLGAEELSVSTVNRRLAESGFRIKNPRVRVEAQYANQEHQMDFSRSKYFQLERYDAERGDFVLRVSGRELHYKRDDRRLRTWIVQVRDSYSRIRIGRAYAATSEDGFIGLETLHFCWNRQGDDHLLHYLPEMLKTDQGSFQKRKEVKTALEALGIEPRRSGAYNHASQGKIESGFRDIWHQFELPLAIKLGDGAKIYLSEYNDLFHEFMIKDMEKAHPILREPRGELYRQSMMLHPPRTIDIDVMQIACKVEYRGPVRETLMISVGNEKYEAPSYSMGKMVRIYRNMSGELMGELVEENRKPFVLQPYRIREIDNFEHRHHQTYRQKMEEEIKEEEERKKEKDKRQKEKEGNRLFMPVKERQQEADSVFVSKEAPTFGSAYQARVYIGGQLQLMGESYADYAEVFDPMLEEDLSKASIDAVLGEIKKMANIEVM